MLKVKGEQQQRAKQPKAEVSLLKTKVPGNVDSSAEVDPAFTPFIFMGSVSVSGGEEKKIEMLRDTGAAQTVILANVLPFSDETSCHSGVLAQGIEMGLLRIPLHNIHKKHFGERLGWRKSVAPV